MNLVTTAPAWLLIILVLLLAAAAIEDAMRLRISNLTCAGVLIAALVAMGFAGFPASLWQNLLLFAALLFGGMFLFSAGKIGGGDVKLLAVIGLWVDLRAGLWLIISVALAGGVLAILYLLGRAVIRRRRQRAGTETTRGPGIPYGLAIVTGAAFVFATQLGWLGPKPARQDPLAIPGLPPVKRS